MFEYFPDNYVWSLGVMLALGCGAEISEIDEACRPLRPLASSGDSGTVAWNKSWNTLAERLLKQAERDAKSGAHFTASAKLKRAAVYFLIAERMMRHGDPEREETYLQMRAAFRGGVSYPKCQARRRVL